MKRPSHPAWTAWCLAARLLAGAVLAASGFAKLMSPAEEFALALEAFQLFPVDWLLPLAQVLPWIELLVGAYLLLGYSIRISAGLTALLFSGFLVALLAAQFRGIALEDCGCFGRSFHWTLGQALVADTVFLLGALSAAWEEPRAWSIDRWLDSFK